MIKKLTATIILAAALLWNAHGTGATTVRDTLTVDNMYSREYLDTVDISRKVVMNDYLAVGFQYGAALSRMMFNPPKDQTMLLTPRNFGFTITHYEKMFGYMPYFGFQLGLFFGQDGYKTRENKQTGSRPTVDGAVQAVYDYIEVPALAIFHADIVNFRLQANLGLYGAYRTKVHRTGDGMLFDETYSDRFYDYDIRLDYGIKGGAGFAYLFDPFEFHVLAQVRYGFSSLYQPDYASEYYYRYAYPFDVVISAGLQFQLTKRHGKTRAALRKTARQMVIDGVKGPAQTTLKVNTDEDTDSNNR